jgi:hypothetical protein
MFLPSGFSITSQTIASLLTPQEAATLSGKAEFSRVIIPVRITIDKQASRDIPVVVRGDFVIPTDNISSIMGLDMVETDTHMTLNGVLTHSNSGMTMLSATPMYGQDIDPSETCFADFRLRADYLRCPLGTVAGDKWENGNGSATIDIATQTVLDIDFHDHAIGQPQPNLEGQLLRQTDTTITVTCVMANGGVNFSGFIR